MGQQAWVRCGGRGGIEGRREGVKEGGKVGRRTDLRGQGGNLGRPNVGELLGAGLHHPPTPTGAPSAPASERVQPLSLQRCWCCRRCWTLALLPLSQTQLPRLLLRLERPRMAAHHLCSLSAPGWGCWWQRSRRLPQPGGRPSRWEGACRSTCGLHAHAQVPGAEPEEGMSSRRGRRGCTQPTARALGRQGRQASVHGATGQAGARTRGDRAG